LDVSLRVAIAGGGVAGLAAAVALKAEGHEVRVYEQRHDPAQGGALLLWSNALYSLGELGLADALLALSTPAHVTEFRGFDGRALWSLPMQTLSQRAGAPTVVISRGDLIAVLRSGVGGDLHTGRRCTGWTDHGDTVVPKFSDGSEGPEADVLLGADGLHSSLRTQLFGEEPVRSLKQVAWVATVDHPALRLPEGTSITWVGPGVRFWLSNLGDQLYWYTTAVDAPSRPAPEAGDHAGLVALHADCVPPVPQLIEATDPASVIRTEIRDRPPRAGWGRGRVYLVGDAAHPMTPDLGQGACQALEDAVVLGRTLGRIPDVPAALDCYEAERRRRTTFLTNLAHLAAQRSMPLDSLGGALRDLFSREPVPTVALPEIERAIAVRV
jgi:2-polyprenyl-6-methoxyphenol hydroxylase-like FAD-dependent oxidoreductase